MSGAYVPYISYPRIIIVGCVTKTIKYLNQIPEKGIFSTASPSTLITGRAHLDHTQVKK